MFNFLKFFKLSKGVVVSHEPVAIETFKHKTIEKIETTPVNNLIDKMCLAIQSREGYLKPGDSKMHPKGSASYRNCNPGNLRYASQVGSIGQRGGFAVFPDYQTGIDALKRQILLVAKGKSRVYPKDCTIQQFFNVYAPHFDDNDPVSYAKEVAKKMGVDVSFKLSGLL